MTQTSITILIFVLSAGAAWALRYVSQLRREQPILITTQLPAQGGRVDTAGANLRAPGPGFILYLCNFRGRQRTVSALLFRYDQGRQLQLGALTLSGGDLGVAMNSVPITLQGRAIHPFACPWSAINAGFIGIEVELANGATYCLADNEVARLKAIAEQRQAPLAPFMQPRPAR